MIILIITILILIILVIFIVTVAIIIDIFIITDIFYYYFIINLLHQAPDLTEGNAHGKLMKHDVLSTAIFPSMFCERPLRPRIRNLFLHTTKKSLFDTDRKPRQADMFTVYTWTNTVDLFL